MEVLNGQLVAILGWLLCSTIRASILVCLILAVKMLLRDKLSPRWHFCLWLLHTYTLDPAKQYKHI